MITGDLPPSSSVTGVRLSAAARITCLPTAVLPVNSRWSKGKAEKAAATSASPITTATCTSSKASSSITRSASAVSGVNSLILIITRLPALRALIKGPIAR